MRVTKALSRNREGDVAVGLAGRLVPSIPLSAQAELRVSRNGTGTEVRPAAMVVTELAPVELPFGARAEMYAQAGYVGGDFATPFADGQAKVDRRVARFDLAGSRVNIRGGAGVWGGAQEGASRVDIGPTAGVDIAIGPAPARVAIDYRHRVAGNAEPRSGVALTLSTGF